MSSQPQVTVQDYFGGKSIVVRAVPEDFFKPYSEYLTNVTGKWNPNLKDPSGEGKMPGWIFPKSKEPQVRQAIQNILSGQVTAQVPRYSHHTTTSSPQTVSMSNAGGLQNALSALHAREIGIAPPVQVTQSSLLTPSIPAGYQEVRYLVIKPVTGGTLKINVNNQVIPVTVESVETENGFTTKAIVAIPDGQKTTIHLMNDQWKIVGYDIPHTINL